MNVQPTPLDHEIELSILIEETIRINWEIKNCLIFVGAELMEADLVPLHIVDFNQIFGMNWLLRHHAHFDCYRKLVSFVHLEGHEWDFKVNGESYLTVSFLVFKLRDSCLRDVRGTLLMSQ